MRSFLLTRQLGLDYLNLKHCDFSDAIASPLSPLECDSVGQSVGNCFQISEILITSTELASLFGINNSLKSYHEGVCC